MRRQLLAALCLLWASPLAAQTLERIADEGVLHLGFRETAIPFSHLDAATGTPAGYSVGLCEAIAADIASAAGLEEVRIEFVPVTAQDRFDALAEGRIDLLCGAATRTLERRAIVDFSVPTFVDGAGIALPRDGATSLEELAGGTVAVVAGTTTEAALARTLEGSGIDVEVLTVVDHDAGLTALQDGTAQAYFADRAILQFLLMSREITDIGLAAEPLTLETHALALPHGDSDFRLAVDRGLSRLYLTGEVQKIFHDAFGPEAEMTDLLRAVYRVSALPL